MKKSSHKGYCQDRAKANPAKGAKAKALSWFEESTGLCKPCVQRRRRAGSTGMLPPRGRGAGFRLRPAPRALLPPQVPLRVRLRDARGPLSPVRRPARPHAHPPARPPSRPASPASASLPPLPLPPRPPSRHADETELTSRRAAGRRAAEPPRRRAAAPPHRRAAEPPRHRTAEPPRRHAAELPSRRAAEPRAVASRRGPPRRRATALSRGAPPRRPRRAARAAPLPLNGVFQHVELLELLFVLGTCRVG